MEKDVKIFLDKLLQFSAASTRWCCEESESATARVSDSIDMILRDTARVSKLSPEALKAVKDLQGELGGKSGTPNRGMGDALARLKKMCADSRDMESMIHPLL